MRPSRLSACLLLVLATISCGRASNTSASAPEPVSVRVVVDTSKNPCTESLATKPGTCYLPLYTRTSFDAPSVPANSAPGSKCTPDDERQCWPQPDTELEAVCQLTGTHIQDSKGRGSSVWYGVVIPPEELLVDRMLLPSTAKDQVVGFASEIWLRRLSQQKLTSCEGVVAFG